jgi:hypothetical protein
MFAVTMRDYQLPGTDFLGGVRTPPINDLHPPKGIWHPRKLHIFWFDSFIFDYSYNQIC